MHPQNGHMFSIRELREIVGGKLDSLQLNDGHVMWMNEDSKRLQLPTNTVADLLAHDESGMPLDEHILGDVLLTNRAESGFE